MTKVLVSERAIVARINRAIAPDRQLRASRGSQMKTNVGDWYVLNLASNSIVAPFKHMSLADIAAEVGVLKDWEKIVEAAD